MALSVGIVGLPNVGKSTLFNAITSAKAEAQNYPFCTIDPNTGIVPLYDSRLEKLAEISKSKEIIPAAIEFVDIAGLVKGAAQGEGLGNKFLSHIREISVIAHVVRCFDDSNVVHVSGAVNPASDIETINLELMLADLEAAEKMLANAEKKNKSGMDKEAAKRAHVLSRICDGLKNNIAVRHMPFVDDEWRIVESCNLLTAKKVVYVANVSEDMIGSTNEHTEAVRMIAEKDGDDYAIISAKIESEIAELSGDEKKEYLHGLGIQESGLNLIAKKCFSLLGLQSFLTSGEKETRAWIIRKGATAPQAAGVIHTDFERGFIRANIVSYDDFVAYDGMKGAREKGLLRQEGKEYIMQDGDVVEFLFNV